MAQRVFFLNRLREGVAPEDYERWIREVDYPLARSLETIRSYVVTGSTAPSTAGRHPTATSRSSRSPTSPPIGRS